MPQQLGPQAIDTSKTYAISLVGDDGLSLAGVYSGSETFSAVLWPGGGYSVSSTIAAAWDTSIAGNPSTQDNPTLLVTINTAAIGGLTPGTFQIRVKTSAARLVWEGSILLESAPGSTQLPRLYSDYAAMVDECSWITVIESLDNARSAQFLPELAQASQWIEQEAMGRWERDNVDQLNRHGPVGYVPPIIPTDGVDAGPNYGPTTIPETSLRLARETFATSLTNYGLMTAYAPDRGNLRRTTALYALYLAMDDQVGKVPASETPIQEMAAKYREKAIRALFATPLYMDTDADGSPNLVLLP